jgi:hypothetical protein
MAVSREYVSGEISEIYDADTGSIQPDNGGTKEDFMQRGAQVEFKVGDKVTYLSIVLPNDKKIIREVGMKTQ